LRTRAPERAFGACGGLIQNLHRAHPRTRHRDEEPGPNSKFDASTFVAGTIAVAYSCGQTGGSSVIAPEITGDFSTHMLWTGGADV
jgi:hypothetical protein